MPFVAHFLTTDVFSAERESGSLQVTETGAAPATQKRKWRVIFTSC